MITEEGFHTILKEYGYTDRVINYIWAGRPNEEISEELARATAHSLLSIADIADRMLKMEEYRC